MTKYLAMVLAALFAVGSVNAIAQDKKDEKKTEKKEREEEGREEEDEKK
ncbi:MAG: hypothetical protein RML56_10275 [Burkholderiales bacterium]|nr:hypothetical protein [Burkholderiales bacterium]